MIDTIRDWYLGLQRREQLLVATAAVFAAVALVYMLLLHPLYSHADTLRDRVERQEDTYSQVDQLVARISAGGNGNETGTAASLLVTANRTATEYGLRAFLQRSEPTSDGSGLSVRFERVPFDRLVEWLGALEEDYSIAVLQGSFDQSQTPGTVNARLTLSR